MGERLAAIPAIELLFGDREPAFGDELARLAPPHVFDRELEVLGPQPLPRRSRKLGLAADEVELAVVEQGVLVQVGGADRQPAIIDDPDLRVDVDQLPALAAPSVERTREESAGASIRVDEHADLSAAVVVAACGMRGQDGDDSEVVSRRPPELVDEDPDQPRPPEELALEVDQPLG